MSFVRRILAVIVLLTLCFGLISARAEGFVFPGGLLEIEEEAFYGDESLHEVTLQEGVLRIGPRAFMNSGLQRIVLPDSLTFIAEDAFSGCDGLRAVASEGSYAYDYCVRVGLRLEEPPELIHEALTDHVLWLNENSRTGAQISLTLQAEGSWTISVTHLPGTGNWLSVSPVSGEGPAQITVTVQSVPGTSVSSRDNYASRLLVQDECGECEAVVALAKKGRYINRHLNTGDYVTDMIGIALSQVGYTGGSNASELDGTPSGRPNDWTKYGAYMGINGNPWCACFLSWCAFQAGIPTSVLKQSTYARPHYFTPGVKTGAVRVYWFGSIPSSGTDYSYLNRYGIRLTRTDTDWAPLPGDFIFFRWNDYTGNIKHIGMVLSCEGDIITYVDGNGNDASDQVKVRTIQRTDRDIVAYYTPWPAASQGQ